MAARRHFSSLPTPRWLGLVPFFLFAFLFLILPALTIVIGAFRTPDGSVTLENILGLNTRTIRNAYWVSIRVSLWSALIGCAIGFAMAAAAVLGGLPRQIRSPLLTFSGVASNFAGVPLAFAFIATIGPAGLITLWLRTEFGIIDLAPGEVAAIPRGVKLSVGLHGGGEPARGYLCENYGGAFTLPERGPIGANCLANQRDFLTPVAAYEDREAPSQVVVKWGGALWAAEIGHSPLDVVAWHGNYAPYKYDLRRFSPVGPILFDHADPSIFTVLTAPSGTPGTANVDFVIFPERWLVAEDTFRPPWYHMNVMSEFMGLIHGQYEAKPQGFLPGGFSLHNCMLPHGPDAEAFEAASEAALRPHRLAATLAFMFETRLPQRVTRYAAELETRQHGYPACWQGLRKRFDPARR